MEYIIINIRLKNSNNASFKTLVNSHLIEYKKEINK